MKEYKE